MHILHITYSLNTGGLERLVLDLSRSLTKRGHAVHVCGLSREERLAPAFREAGVAVHAIPKKEGLDFSLPGKLAGLIRRIGADIVHTHNVGPWLYGSLAARMAGRKCVHTEHSNVLKDETRRQVIERFLQKITHTVICDAEKVKRHMIRTQKLKANNLVTVYNGIDTGKYTRGRRPGASRQDIGLSDDNFVIGIVARLEPVKDHATLFKAFEQLAGTYPKARLVVIGDGSQRAVLENQGRSSALEGKVFFLGNRDDVENLLGLFDCFVLSSTSEGLPLAVLEAMACGLPVVATDVGAMNEVVIEGQTGFLAPAGRPDALAASLERLLADPAAAARMGKAGRARVEKLFSLEAMVEKYIEVYRKACPSAKHPASQ